MDSIKTFDFRIDLASNKGYNWYNEGNIYVIGFAFLDNYILKDMTLTEYVKDCVDKSTFKDRISKLNGFFSIVIRLNEGVCIATDIVRSFPVFYAQINNETIITDDVDKIQHKIIDEDSFKEFLTLGYTTGENTLYKNIKQVECSNCLFISNDGEVEKNTYFQFQYNIKYEDNEQQILNDIGRTYDNVAKKMISFLNGRTAVIPLSGGHDSRLITYLLKKYNYENVITYTYGRVNNEEALVSKKVADYLGYDWEFVPYKTKTMQKMYNNPDTYNDMADYCGRGFTVPHIQDWMAIDYLYKNNIIDKNCVIIPGHTGDFLTGGHLREEFIKKDYMMISELIEMIIDFHYIQYKYRNFNKNLTQLFNKRISESLNIEMDNKIGAQEAACLFERFDYKERQCKHICNSVRLYEYYGLQWYMPLWHKEVVNQWLKIPIKFRYNREIYEKYTFKEYGDLMRYAPVANIYNKSDKKQKNKIVKFIENCIKVYTNYSRHFLNYYGYINIKDYLKFNFKYRTSLYYFMFSYKYLEYIKKKDSYLGKN